MTITGHPFLDEDRCAAIVAELLRRDDLAIDRNPAVPGTFVTYGRAAYLDYCLPRADPQRDYLDAAPAVNAALLEAFPDLFADLLATMSAQLGGPACYRPDLLAVPGIHIFRGIGIRSAGEAGVHFDVQYQRLPMPAPPDPGTSPVSFTVLLEAPRHGTGLRVHDVTFADYERAYLAGRIDDLGQLVARRTSAYLEYTPGTLFIHRNLVVHTLWSPGPVQPDDARITLQGHGLRCGGEWILYW